MTTLLTTTTTTTSITAASTVTGSAGNDKLSGGSGNDLMDGGAGSDQLNAGSGDDTLVYNLSANGDGARDVYTGGSGIDVVRVLLTQAQWTDPLVRMQLERYVAHLDAVQRNLKGEVSNGTGRDFTFSFANGSTLTVQMTERLEVGVQDAGGTYTIIDHLMALITGTSTGGVTEAGGVANATAGTRTASGLLQADDLDGPDNAFQAVAPGTASLGGFGTCSVTASGAWEYTLDDGNPQVQQLQTGVSMTDTFAVLTLDGAVQTVTITITGQNDAATITGQHAGTAIEAGGVANGTLNTATVQGDLDAADVDNAPDEFRPVTTAAATAGGYGTYVVTDAGVWTFSLDNANTEVQGLREGQELTDSFEVQTVDGTGQQVTVTIVGSNDAASITATLPEDTAVVEAGGAGNAVAGDATASGTLAVHDVDSGEDHFAEMPADRLAGTYGDFTFDSQSGAWTYALDNARTATQALAAGEQASDALVVGSADDTASHAITVGITGANDHAAIAGTTSGIVVEAGTSAPGAPTATGTLTASDLDNPPNAFLAVDSATASVSGYGAYTVTAGGLWTYVLDDANATVDALASDGTLTDSFVVRSIDGTSQSVSITIQGTTDLLNHAPTDIALQVVSSDDKFPGKGILATLTTNDPDAGDAHTYTLLPGSNAIFGISEGSSELSIQSILERSSDYVLHLRATDPAGAHVDETFHVITGATANQQETLPGGTTDDLLYGQNGSDIILAGDGNDSLFGQNGSDRLEGGSGHDVLNGGDGNDALLGQDGNDWLLGGNGNDTVTGGAGADSFVFSATGPSNADTIADFLSGTDKIVLDDSVFTALPPGGLSGSAFVAGAGPATVDTRIIYNPSSGVLSYDANGAVGGGLVQIAIIGVGAHPTLAASDFEVI